MGHRGKHAAKYHQWVLDRLRAAVRGSKDVAMYRSRLVNELDAIRTELRRNPGLLKGFGL
jgi:hypothetical protein